MDLQVAGYEEMKHSKYTTRFIMETKLSSPGSVPAPPSVPNVVDWTAIRKSSRTFTFEGLAHYAHTGINPYTISIVQALCSQFTISARAKQDLAAVRERLSASPDEGTRCVLLDLTATDDGLVALGICGILNETFQQEALGLVFRVLDASSAVPNDLRPLYHSWKELNELCGKVQLPDVLHERVENFSRLTGSPAETTQSPPLEYPGPQLVVDGLQAMSRLCSGEEEGPILVLAGHYAGWCAAVAE